MSLGIREVNEINSYAAPCIQIDVGGLLLNRRSKYRLSKRVVDPDRVSGKGSVIAAEIDGDMVPGRIRIYTDGVLVGDRVQSGEVNIDEQRIGYCDGLIANVLVGKLRNFLLG